jgi:hypothetical protein
MLFCSTSCISQKKKVHFSKYIREISNPTYIEESSFKNLWWSQLDKYTACYMMKLEIHNLQKIHPSMTIKQAMKLLYQPNNICYDPNNFIN